MATIKEIYKTCTQLKIFPVQLDNFDDYLISREGKLYYLDPETGEVKDISHIIFDYTKKGVPIYRLLDLKDNSKFLEIRLDKLVLNTFIGDLEGKIIHKDSDPLNCSLDNLKYELDITKIDNSDSLWINNKEFKKIYESDSYISNDGIVYNNPYNRLLKRILATGMYYANSIKNKNYSNHYLVYSTWIGDVSKELTINHKDGNKWNNHYSNLELMTHAENRRHAHNTGLSKCVWNEDDIHIICKMMEGGKSFNVICEQFKKKTNKEKKSVTGLLNDLRSGRLFKDISSQYTINNYYIDKHCAYSKVDREKVKSICKLLEARVPKEKIAKDLNVSIDIIKSIMYKKAWVNISSNFNISVYKDIPKNKIPESTISKVQEFIKSGLSNKEISIKLNIKKNIIKYIRRKFNMIKN